MKFSCYFSFLQIMFHFYRYWNWIFKCLSNMFCEIWLNQNIYIVNQFFDEYLFKYAYSPSASSFVLKVWKDKTSQKLTVKQNQYRIAIWFLLRLFKTDILILYNILIDQLLNRWVDFGSLFLNSWWILSMTSLSIHLT